MFAVIRIRGTMGVRSAVAQALKQLKLTRVNHCVLLPENDQNKKLLVFVKDIVAWGKTSEEVVAALQKKGKAPYRLHPPIKGYGDIKIPYPRGSLGNHGDKIDELLKRMI